MVREEPSMPLLHVIGGGLAGPEAAWQAARLGHRVVLHEMRPGTPTPVHRTGHFAELVCSNSFKSDQPGTAPWLLKEELRRLGSLLMEAAAQARVPGGHALTVDRDILADYVTRRLEAEPRVEIRREEVTVVPDAGVVVIATGPLTSDALADSVVRLTGRERLFFYDAISPIIEADSIDDSKVYRASRYDKSLDGTQDYLNCPFTREEYERFYDALISAESAPGHDFENTPFFEACLPIEELARRGRDTLRFGPMKPVGLRDPQSGRTPYAVVQLRQENLRAGTYNLVGFQNHLKYGEQARVLRLIPGLENAEFTRFGQIHRNTYINAPALLQASLNLRSDPRIFFAGQISGVEGYVEAMATGLIAGRNAARLAEGKDPLPPPRETAHGSLAHYVSSADPRRYQPANITFDLLPALPEQDRRLAHDKAARRRLQCDRALAALENYCAEFDLVASR
jgi:methylenetetrahydrofolate--tRNA-(uracil-5-)-methyltransferase